MRWKDKVEQYANRMTSSGADDMICRRVWKGLGLSGAYSSQKIGEIEKLLTGGANYQALDIQRVMAVAMECILRSGKSWPWTYETLEISSSEDVQDRIDSNGRIEIDKPWPLFLARLKSNTTVLSYALHPRDQIGTFFTPPYQVIKGDMLGDFVIQDVEAFIRQFGPFNNIFEGI